MTRRSYTLLLIGICLALSAPVLAHDVVVERVVEVNAQVQGGHLLLQLHVPLGAITDAAIPRTGDGALAADTDSAALLAVAGDAVRNLDVRQDDQPLRAPRFTAKPSADRTALDVDVDFVVNGAHGLSARLNAFKVESPLTPVVSLLRFREVDGREDVMRVTGPASRVLMNPDAGDVLGRFAASGARLAMAWADHILLLLCLLALPRSARSAVGVVGVLAAGQAAGLLLYAGAPASIAAAVPVAGALSASCAAIAALQLIVQARSGYVSALAIAAGILSGVGLGHSLAADIAFSGAHPALAALAFAVATIGVEAWLGGLIFATRGWLSGVGTATRMVNYAVAAFVAHTAIHHFMDAGTTIEQDGSFLATHALVVITLGWAVIMLALAVREALWSRPSARPDLVEVGSV